MLICNVLIPRMTYGVAMYGGCSKLLRGMDKVVGQALAAVARKGKCCRAAMHEEMGVVKTIEAARVTVATSLNRWAGSRGIVGNLVRQPLNLRRSKGSGRARASKTMLNTIRSGMKRLGLEGQRGQEVRRKVQEALGKLKSSRPRSKTAAMREEIGRRGGQIRDRVELDPQVANFVARARMGAIPTRAFFEKTGRLGEEWKGRCLHCREERNETIQHLLAECRALEGLRAQHLQRVSAAAREQGGPERVKVKLLATILMGSKTARGAVEGEYTGEIENFVRSFLWERRRTISMALM